MCRRAAEERDELPPPHSITSSARASSVADVEAKGLRGLEVDDELEPGRLIDRQVGGFLALEDAAGVDAGLTVPSAMLVP